MKPLHSIGLDYKGEEIFIEIPPGWVVREEGKATRRFKYLLGGKANAKTNLRGLTEWKTFGMLGSGTEITSDMVVIKPRSF